MSNDFVKHDCDKLQWHLLPMDLLEGVVKVLEHGAAKYGEFNWQKCESPQRYSNALMRHLVELGAGNEIDRDSGLLHIDHIICNAIFLKWFAENR